MGYERKYYCGFDADPLPDDIIARINRPHDHEGPNNEPLWLFWMVDISGDGLTDGPQLKCIADSVKSGEHHAAMYLDEVESRRSGYQDGSELHLHIERVPANHGFGAYDFSKCQEFAERRANMKRFRQTAEREG